MEAYLSSLDPWEVAKYLYLVSVLSISVLAYIGISWIVGHLRNIWEMILRSEGLDNF